MDPYAKAEKEYRGKVEEALRKGGVGSASAEKAVKSWGALVRTSMAVARRPATVAKEIARYEGLHWRAPAPQPAKRVRRK